MRDHLQILAYILVLCRIPRNKTAIMQKTNSNHTSLVRYLNFLQHPKLMEIHHSETSYLTTPKDLNLLRSSSDCKKIQPSKPKNRHNLYARVAQLLPKKDVALHFYVLSCASSIIGDSSNHANAAV